MPRVVNPKNVCPTRRESPLPSVLEFMQVLWAVTHGLEKSSKRMSQAIGVTGPQRLALRVVGLFPGVSAGDLATILRLHPSTLTGILQRLVSQRLLERTGDPGDRRRVILRLTPLGARANALRHGTVEAAITSALAGIRERDQIVTRRVLTRLADHLGQTGTNAGRAVVTRPQAPRKKRRAT